MKRHALVLAVAALLLAPSAEAATSRAPIVQVPTGICMIHANGGIGCFGTVVPARWTDGYLHLRKRGKVRMGDAGGLLAPVSSRPKRLRKGDRWVKRGVRCRVISGGVKCQNRARRGFRLRKQNYRTW